MLEVYWYVGYVGGIIANVEDLLAQTDYISPSHETNLETSLVLPWY